MELKEILKKPYFKIDKDKYTDERLAEMSLEELKVLKSRVEMKIHTISAAIQAKKSDYLKTGIGASHEWYANHKFALGVNQRVLPVLADLIKQRNRVERSIADYFIDEARNYLDKKTFDAIMKNAEREKKLLLGIK